MPGEMNPRERWGLLLIDEFPDRPPAYPLVTSHAARVYGCNLIEYCTDGIVLAEAQISAQRRYGHEGLSVFTDVGIIAESMGSIYHLQEFEVPILDKPVIFDTAQIDDLELPDPGSKGRLPVYLDAVDRLFTTMGDILPVFAFIPCPFTTAAGLRGVENFLTDTILESRSASKLLEISLQAAILLCDECILAGALPILVDPLASGSVISSQTFGDFALPYQQRLIEYLHRYDLDITLHICGDTSRLLHLVAQSGADLFSFDQVGIKLVRNAMGEKIRLVGNFAPHGLLDSSTMDVMENTASIINDGIKSSRGFVLSTGCEVPIRCDAQKLASMIRLGKNCRYDKGW